MPECKYCRTQLALCEFGAICPKCRRFYSVNQVKHMPDYNHMIVREAYELFQLLRATGMIKKGVNRLTFGDDDFSLEHEQGDW